MVDLKLGKKRNCEACEAKFYDLNKIPAICPKCGHSFDPTAEAVAATPRKIEPEVEAETQEDDDALEDDDDSISLDALVDDEDDDEDDESLPEFEDDEDDQTLLDDDDDDDDDSFIEDDEDDD